MNRESLLTTPEARGLNISILKSTGFALHSSAGNLPSHNAKD